MSALVPRDPLPGKPLVFRIDMRAGRDCIFWCRVRQAFLPKLKSSVFWASDTLEVPNWHPEEDQCVVLPRPLLLQYQPDFVRLNAKEREQLRRYHIDRDPTYIRDSAVTQSLKISRLLVGRNLSTLGWNSYHLSP